jgi:hypothetical protein
MKKKYLLLFLIFHMMIFFSFGCSSVDFSSLHSSQLKKLLLFTQSINQSISRPMILRQPISQTVTEGSSVTFSVIMNNETSSHFQWEKNGTAVGTDKSTLIIASANGTDTGIYTVTISNPNSELKSKPAILTVIPASLSNRSFVFGVWLQEPATTYNGKTLAQNYSEIGINTFIDLWSWPEETDMYAGYALDSMQALKDAGMNVYAGNNEAAVNWINAHPEFWNIFKGYVLGDEPDMLRDSGVPQQAAANTPLAWKALGDELLSHDSTRDVYANFGKPFSKDVWYGNENGQTGSQESDFELYVSPTDIISSDFYGITDPWENPNNHGIWTYGRSVKNTIKWANHDGNSRPAWGFVETSAPWTDASSNNWMYQRMPPSLIMPIVWNMVISGAQGILYFCHDFSPVANKNLGCYAALLEPGMPAAMKAANASVSAYGAVLLTPDIAGTSAVTNGGVDVITLTKQFEGDTYIFAMGNGNSDYRDGQAVDAQITVSGQTGTKTVTVINDMRTVSMVNGKINDHFEPYEIHIYKIDN